MGTDKRTIQEMFDRAVIGLRSQGFERCADVYGQCCYADGKGRHCAWGWVDTELTSEIGGIGTLSNAGTGLAKDLTHEEVAFVSKLQCAHDGSSPLLRETGMEPRLRALADQYGLDYPETVREEAALYCAQRAAQWRLPREQAFSIAEFALRNAEFDLRSEAEYLAYCALEAIRGAYTSRIEDYWMAWAEAECRIRTGWTVDKG